MSEIISKKIMFHYGAWRARCILSSRPIPIGYDAGVEIHMMCGQSHVLMALWALKSFYYFSKVYLPIIIHDDGTLDKQGSEILKGHFPGIRIIERTEANRYVLNKLNSAPLSRLYRTFNVFGIMLFDYFIFGNSKRILSFDADILFFNEPKFLLDLIRNPASNVNTFMEDVESAYSIDLSFAKEHFHINLHPKINTGFGLAQRSLMDINKIEQFLQKPEMFSHLARLEQGALALLLSETLYQHLPKAYNLSLDGGVVDSLICRHYVTCIRQQFYTQGIFHLLKNADFSHWLDY